MGKQIVNLGKQSSHGGTMTTATGNFKLDGVKVCVDGDMHTCPIQGHGETAVTASGSGPKSNHKVVLHVGDVAGCGAVITQGSTDTSS